MTTNAFTANARPRAKIIRLVGPGNIGAVRAEITIGSRTILVEDWNPATVAAALAGLDIPEFEDLAFAASGNDILVTGPEDDDFEVRMSYRPTVTITNNYGVNAVNQWTALHFDGARAGTYTLTVNGKTTSAVTYGDGAGLITAIEALAGFTAGDAAILSAEPDLVLLEWKGTLAGTPVAVTMNASGLHNGRTLHVSEFSAYNPGPHDVWGLAMLPSTTCEVTIDGNAATLRSDHSLAEVTSRLRGLSSRRLNVYGGPHGLSDADGITGVHYILDFAGWDASTRPTVSITVSDGDADVSLMSNPAHANGVTTYSSGSSSNTSHGRVNHWLADFSTGPIRVEYDGIQFDLPIPSYGSHATDVGIIQKAIRDVSEYDEALVREGPPIDTVTGTNLFNPSVTSAAKHGKMVHIINVNDSIRQVSGAGRLVQLNRAGTAVEGAKHDVWAPAGTNGGTYRLLLSEGLTATISGTANAATVEAAVSALITGATVTGAGLPSNPWRIAYPSALGSRALPVPNSVALAGNGSGSVTTDRAAVASQSQSVRISISTSATSGTVGLKFGTEGPILLTHGDAAAVLDAALATLPSIGDAANVDTTRDATAGVYDITFVGSLAGKLLPALTVSNNSLAIVTATAATIEQLPTGPKNVADPLNWSLARLPRAGDTVVFADELDDVRYGLRQFVPVTADAATDVLTVTGGHDLSTDQVIRFLSSGSLPGGLSAGTDYYVLNANQLAGTFRVSLSLGGAAVNITSAGTGTHYAGILVTDILVQASFPDAIGRPSRINGQVEYRPRYFRIGATGLVHVGSGIGSGSPLVRLDLGISTATVQVDRTASSDEANRGAVGLLTQGGQTIRVNGGDVGLAEYDGESASVGQIDQGSGTLICGTVAATSIRKRGGRLLARDLTVSGTIKIQG